MSGGPPDTLPASHQFFRLKGGGDKAGGTTENRYAPGPPRRNGGGGSAPAPMSLDSAPGAGEFDIHELVRQGLKPAQDANSYSRTTIDRRSGLITTGKKTD